MDVPTSPANFELLGLEHRVRHHLGDIRDRERLAAVIDEVQPELVFHLAAQSLVRRSYNDPVTTFETNALGMVNLLECLRTGPLVANEEPDGSPLAGEFLCNAVLPALHQVDVLAMLQLCCPVLIINLANIVHVGKSRTTGESSARGAFNR